MILALLTVLHFTSYLINAQNLLYSHPNMQHKRPQTSEGVCAVRIEISVTEKGKHNQQTEPGTAPSSGVV